MLESLGNIGEFVAAVGVIISLIFVGFQVREHTKQLRAGAIIDRNSHAASYLAVLSREEEAEIYLRGLESYPELSPVERVRFQAILIGILNSSEITFIQENSFMKQGDLVGNWKQLQVLLSNPGARNWWNRNGHSIFSEEFHAFVTGLLADS